MKQPLVSVLSITYNHAPYIAQAIESFLAQETTFPLEIVIGEDCSTDGTTEIVLNYAKRYPNLIRVITSETNVGVIPNFLRTLEVCRGKYIAICEGDDYWHYPQKLQMQVDFLEANPDYGMVHTDYDRIECAINQTTKSYYATNGIGHLKDADLHTEHLLGNYPVCTPTICIRSSTLKDTIKLDPLSFNGQYLMADLMIITGAAYRSRIHFIQLSTAVHRRLTESASMSRDLCKLLTFSQSLYDATMHIAKLYHLPQGMQKILHHKWANRILMTSFLANDRVAAEAVISGLRERNIPIPAVSYFCLYALRWAPLGIVLRTAVSMRRIGRKVKKII
jgi:glycosyltransferase involved in cell wall biosynthesis